MREEMVRLLNSRPNSSVDIVHKRECEGGCGVIGFASTEKIQGRHLLGALKQMKNRGNGKGGGIAAVGMDPTAFNTTQAILDNNYLLAIAYLDASIQKEVETRCIAPLFELDHMHQLTSSADVAQTVIYFVRVKQVEAERFRELNKLEFLEEEAICDEIIYQNSARLNSAYYNSAGQKRAFVLSHAKNLLVLKCIGYADDTIRKYHIEELKAHIWMGHNRYPTKGKVWHPGGAHPFIGLHEALVHNGDFANYSALCTYLSQRNVHPQFLTDTEVAALLFDLLHRNYRYPLEYVMEALAPTTESDFFHLDKDKQQIYDAVQKTHLHASPDGPWFFIIAQSLKKSYRLIGITDTSMLRPQVFAEQRGAVSIGLIASEKQAIDALLFSLSQEDGRFWPTADRYWSCRGGSQTDGGAFTFTIHRTESSPPLFSCGDKFGKPSASEHSSIPPPWQATLPPTSTFPFPDLPQEELFDWAKSRLSEWSCAQALGFFTALIRNIASSEYKMRAFFVLKGCIDFIFPLKQIRRSYLQAMANQAIEELVCSLAGEMVEDTLILNAQEFAVEGQGSLSLALVENAKRGIKRFIVGNLRGHRFIASGLGPKSHGVTIELFGSSGDYLGSGIDGASVIVHGNLQDQGGQIMKDGKLIVYGDSGQTLLYGAKGGVGYIRGGTAGRALINAVGCVKLIINGTALDYFAESFMAGDPLKRGGFAIINRIAFDHKGSLIDLDLPYPGGNLFSLASGGAIYIRDPEHQINLEQLNGGKFTEMTPLDQNLITPYLEENERLFAIPISRLLEYKNKKLTFNEAYRKILPDTTHFINPEKAWLNHKTKKK